MAYNVLFKKGTQEAYNALETKNANTLYFITDTPAIYLGSTKFTSVAELTAALTRIEANETAIGTLSSLTTTSKTNLVAAINEVVSSIGSLATVASSGAAADVSVADSGDNFEATTVEGALAELAGDIAALDTASTITVEKDTTAQTGYAASYTVKQNNQQVGVKINIPKDFLVKSATVETCATADDPVAGYKVGDKYIDFVVNTTDASETATHIYLLVDELVDVYTGTVDATGVTISVNASNQISATINAVDGSVINAGTVAKSSLASGVQGSLDLADSAVQSVVTGTTAGAISVDDTAVPVYGLANVATSGAATDVQYKAASGSDPAESVGAALTRIDTAIGTGGSVDTKISNAIGALDGSADATDATAAHSGTVVLQKVVQVDGVIDDTQTVEVEVEAAGAAAAVVGANTDASTANTVYGAKAYADSLATNYDAAGDAATAEANAKAYTDTALTWGTL